MMILLARGLALAASVGFGVTAFAAAAPKPGRAIHVQGSQFLDAQGRPVVFRGVALADPDKLERDGQWRKRTFDEVKAWGANIVRLPVHPAAWRPFSTTACAGHARQDCSSCSTGTSSGTSAPS
jgi:hypothetical protein